MQRNFFSLSSTQYGPSEKKAKNNLLLKNPVNTQGKIFTPLELAELFNASMETVFVPDTTFDVETTSTHKKTIKAADLIDFLSQIYNHPRLICESLAIENTSNGECDITITFSNIDEKFAEKTLNEIINARSSNNSQPSSRKRETINTSDVPAYESDDKRKKYTR